MEFLRERWLRRRSDSSRQGAALTAEGGVPLSLGAGRGSSFEDDYGELRADACTEAIEPGKFMPLWSATRCDGLKSAVKIVPRADAELGDLTRLRNEAQLLDELDHDNVVKLHGWYEEQDAFYTAVEFCDGGELFDRTASKKTYSEAKARALVMALLTTVKYLHERGVVLRALQPEHLLLSDTSDDAKLKIASLKYATKDFNDNFPINEQSCSPEYLAPEVLKSNVCAPPADMWSVGVITFALVGGYLPFSGYDQVKLLRNIKQGRFEFHQDKWRSISPSVQSLIKRMLTVAPESRITAEGALDHEWVQLRGELLEAKDLSASLGRLRLANARRKFRSTVFQIIIVSYALTGGMSDGDAANAYRVAMNLTRSVQFLQQKRPRETWDGEEKVVSPTIAATSMKASNSSTHMDCSLGETEAGNIASAGGPGKAQPVDVLHKSSGRSSTLHWPKRVTLASKLSSEPGFFKSSEDGVQLTVRGSSPPDPTPVGSVELERTAFVVTCDYQEYLVGLIVHCSPNKAVFPSPLLVDLFLKHGTSRQKRERELDGVLTEYQVLRRKGTNDSWQALPKDKLKLIRSMDRERKRMTFVRVEVDHFCCLGLSKRFNKNSRYSFREQPNTKSVIIHNGSGENLFVVMLPTMVKSSATRTVEVLCGVNVAGAKEQGDELDSKQNMRITLPTGMNPCYKLLSPGSISKMDLEANGDCVRLIMCTLKDVANTGRVPASNADLHYWDSLNAYGGRDIGILPAFSTGVWQRVCTVDKGDNLNIAHAAIGLDGSYAPAPPTASTPKTRVQRKQGLLARMRSLGAQLIDSGC